MLEVGLRVVRGHDWIWKDQDGGEGHAGTVVEIGKPPTPPVNGIATTNSTDKTPDKTVIVQWDHGSRSNYRIGYQDHFDLLVFDNAAAGVQHNNIICDGCKRHGIIGIRWKCGQCNDYDLCTQCYMDDIHDLTHSFKRFQTANAIGVQLAPRKGCTKIPLKGIFIGATVIRGPDWEWSNQDGGPGKKGKVIDIRGWDNESRRSVATVTWRSGNTNVYRLGYKGCVDLCYIEKSMNGFYYKEHLPVLGQKVKTMVKDENATIQCENVSNTSSPCHLMFNVGDKVKILREVESLKKMQVGHGEWNPRMADYIGKIGTIHRITDKGDIRVQYEGCNNRWTFHPRALIKVTSKDNFVVGDIVRVKSDIELVKNCQQGHGEWIDIMKSALGKLGLVIKTYPDGDLRVTLDGHTWTFNPLSIVKIASGQGVDNVKKSQQTQGNDPSPVNGTTKEIEKVFRYAARSEVGLSAVRVSLKKYYCVLAACDFLKKYSGRVDISRGKKTFLQVAAHQGDCNFCVLLLDAGASLRAIDEDGDSPLHYAAFGNQAGVMELLLNRGAPIDAVNNSGCTALHVSVNKENTACAQVLLRHGCNVNLQDFYGDTALHDAISKDTTEIMDALINYETVDFTVQNKRGFNVLHHAALKGNAHATKRLTTRIQHLVDVKKDDGFAALHLAALNGHREVAALLLSEIEGRATVDLRTNRKQTPLHLAVSHGHWALVELLLRHHADILTTDEDGDTVLHIAIAKSRHQSATTPTKKSHQDATMINAIWQDLMAQNGPTELTLACFLVSIENYGSFLMQTKNSKGKTPLDLVPVERSDVNIADILRSYLHFRRRHASEIKRADVIPVTNEKLPTLSIITMGEDKNKDCKNDTKKSAGHVSTKRNSPLKVEERLLSDEVTKKKEEQKEKEKDKDLEILAYLQKRLADLEEANMCKICMERRRNVAFLCGHSACEHCVAPLKTCHMCRKTITKKINLY